MSKKIINPTRIIPCSVVLLSVETKEKKDAMTATTMSVSEDPPLVTVSVAKHIVSHELIERAGEFVLNIASTEQVNLAKQLGSTHGSMVEKFNKFKIKTAKASKVKSPLIKDAFACLECQVITSITAANYTVYLAEVVAHHVNNKLKPVTWFNNTYFSLTPV